MLTDPNMKLTTLKPRLATLDTRRVPALTTATERVRGRAWMETRMRIQQQQESLCVDCGRLWRPHLDHVDHDIPLERGGSNEDSNLRLRCWDCHQAKTAQEAAQRASGGR